MTGNVILYSYLCYVSSIPDVIGSVFASDIDQNENSIVSYSMTPSSPYFSIAPQSGAITVNAPPPAQTFVFTVSEHLLFCIAL